MKIRIIALLVLCLIVFSSCANDSGAVNNETEASEAITELTSVTTEAEILTSGIDAVDFDGYEFTILSFINPTWPRSEFYAETMNGDVLNDAIYERNNNISEKFNITVNSIETNSGDTEYKKSITAGDDTYDTGMLNIGSSISLAVDSYVTDLNTVEYLDFTKPWWSVGFISDSSIMNKIMLAPSCMNLYAYDTTPIILFNKTLTIDYNIGDLYKTVTDGEWTFDFMNKASRNVSEDIDGNGEMDLKDKYGIVGNNYISDVFLYGTDIYFISKDENDVPYIDVDMDKTTAVTDKMLELTAMPYSYVADRNKGVDREAAPLNAFSEGRALFWPSPISAVFKLRQTETDFGLLPVPKFDLNQENYTSFITTAGTCFTVPKTAADTSRTGMIIEDMAYQSYITVMPAYYDATLNGKLLRDNESGAMLDIVFSSYVCDLGNLFRGSGFGYVQSLRSIITTGEQNAASIYAANESKYQSVIDSIIEKFSAIE